MNHWKVWIAAIGDRLPQLSPQVWILVVGRLLSATGTGFTLFYAPIFFTQLGLSKTLVGLALGSAQISGVVGRVLSGSMLDTPRWGRRRTLMLSGSISAIASFTLAAASGFPSLVLGNLIAGLGIGFYWPATEASIADLTEGNERQEAYAFARLGDSLGLGLGIVLGAATLAFAKSFRLLFIVDGISFLLLVGVVFFFIPETYRPTATTSIAAMLANWRDAVGDRALVIFLAVNTLLTTYISQVHSTLPLYFNETIAWGSAASDSPAAVGALFTWHMALAIAFQLPVARFLGRFSHANALSVSAMLWAMGFLVVGLTGFATSGQVVWALAGAAILAIATVAYTPFASALVVDLAPGDRRGLYLSLNSLCWAFGYFIGPPLGGFALDRPRPWSDTFWILLALSCSIAVLVLQYLNHLITPKNVET